MVKREDKMTIGEARALAAEQLLERKRIGLECAIEALETVGYHVRKDEQGNFRVTQLFSVFDQLDVDALRPSSIVQDDFLGEYPRTTARIIRLESLLSSTCPSQTRRRAQSIGRVPP